MSQQVRMIREGKVVGPSNDKGPHKLVDIESDGKTITARVLDLGGGHITPMKDGIALLLFADGDEGKCYAICAPPPAKRIDGQKEGEMRFKNHRDGREQTIEMTDDGDVIITAPNGIVHINP